MKKQSWVGTLIVIFSFQACGGTTSSDGQSTTSSILEDSNELLIALTLPNISGKEKESMIFHFFDNHDFEGDNPVVVSVPVDLTGEEGDVGLSYSLIDFQEGTYYLRVFLDENDNTILDTGEIFGTYQSDDDPQKVKVKNSTRVGLSVRLDQIN